MLVPRRFCSASADRCAWRLSGLALRQRRLGQLGSVDSAGAVEVEEEEEAEEKPAKEKE